MPTPREEEVRATGRNALKLAIVVITIDTNQKMKVDALLDSGATGSFVDDGLVKEQGWNTKELERPRMVANVDGTLNVAGSVRRTIDLMVNVGEHQERMTFAVTNLGNNRIILGHDWLKRHNPSVNWVTNEVSMTRCPRKCRRFRKSLPSLLDVEKDEDEMEEEVREEVIAMIRTEEPLQIHASETISQRLAREATPIEEMTKAGLIPDEYQDFHDVFDKAEFDKLPERRPWDHAIELKPDAQPKTSKIYPLSPTEQVELDKFLDEHLKSGRIRTSKSPMASPFFFVKKKDSSTLRPVQDYRSLNDMTVKNRYPLPLISELVDKLKGAHYFTKLDVRWGYNNIRIREGDEWKAAFRTNRGLFEPLVMYFGLTNSPATFQTMMDEIFKDVIDRCVVIVYMDDILIFTRTYAENVEVTRQVLEILRQHKLSLNAAKCQFHQEELEYLGLVISHNSVSMDPVKVEGVVKWPAPTKKKELQSFCHDTS